MKKNRLKLALWTTCVTIVWLAGGWAFTFWNILKYGYMHCVEPNQAILITEFCVATAISVIALVVGFAVLLSVIKNKTIKERR